MRYRHLVHSLIIVLAFGFVASTLLGLALYQYGQTDHAAPADVIIILGAGTTADGGPTRSHARRIEHGVALYTRGLAPFILCTGGYTQAHPKSEAQACAEYAEALGVPASAILKEENSRSTEENAIEARKVMAAYALKTALLVSDNYHLWRAEMLFHTQGIRVFTSPAQVTGGPLYWRTAIVNMYREVAASGWYVFKTTLGLNYTNLKP
jgi:uncharacterized SAM-binding protein YcdF (DUF218 family)